MKSEIIYKNDHVSNIKDISYLEKENYIAKKVNAGHDYILEQKTFFIEGGD